MGCYDGSTIQHLTALNLQHKAAARLKVEGKRNAYIAEELGVAVRTLHVWFSDDLMKAEIERLSERIDDIFTHTLATLGLRALNELSDFADTNARRIQAHCGMCQWFGDAPIPHGDPAAPCNGPWKVVEYIGESTKLDALREVLDRVDRTARLRDRAQAQAALPDSGGTQNYLQIFQQMDDDSIAALLHTWATGGNGNGNGNGNGSSPSLPTLTQ